jgi:RHS repeat-associated protein
VGNRRASDETANWNYNANHQLLSYGEPASSTSLDYDPNGSTITKTITHAGGSDTDAYSYDIANRLTEVKRNGITLARYYYDPFGRRLSKEVSGVKTYFLYANEGLVGEYNSSGVLINSYMYQPDSMWGTQPLGMMTGGESYFYQYDQLGSPNLVTSNTGQIKWQGAIDAFGKVEVDTNAISSPLRFSGQFYDQESGLHYNMFRDYDPEIGRYIQSDPIGLAGGINTYGYVSGNPIMLYDPDGLLEFGGGFSGQFLIFGGGVGVKYRETCKNGTLYAESVFTGAINWGFGLALAAGGPGGGNLTLVNSNNNRVEGMRKTSLTVGYGLGMTFTDWNGYTER